MVGLFWWAYASVVHEEATDPLSDLHIHGGVLSRERVDSLIRELGGRYHDQAATCLVVSVAVGDEDRHLTFGRLTNGMRPDERTIFELASVGKTFTGVVLADMALRGEVLPETPVDALLPPDSNVTQIGGHRITLHQLATQSSGLPSIPGNMPATDPLNPYSDYNVPLMYEELRRLKLEFPPGRRYCYSNLGFGLLGHVLALKAGMEYEQMVVERICQPLNMQDTTMTLSEEQRARIATPHDGDTPVKVWDDSTMAGAGSILSTPSDMVKYIRAHWDDGKERLSQAMRLAMRKHGRTDLPQRAIGYAWHIDSENALDIIWHNGGSGGSRSYVAMLPDRRLGVCVLANWSQANVDELGRKVLYLLVLQQSRAAKGVAELSHALEPAAEPVANGKSSLPAQ